MTADLLQVQGIYESIPTGKFVGNVEQMRTERRAARKAATGKGRRFSDSWVVKVGPCYLKAEFFDKLLTAMERIGATELMVRDDRRTVYAKTDAGQVLLMPVAKTTQEVLVLA